MKHATKRPATFLPENRDRVALGFARMDHEWQGQPPGEPALSSEDPLLGLSGGEVVMVVETDLANGTRGAVTTDGRPHHRGRVLFPPFECARLVWMDADRGSDTRPKRARHRRTLRLDLITGSDDAERVSEPGGSGAIDDGRQVLNEGVIGKVTVGVDHDDVRLRA